MKLIRIALAVPLARYFDYLAPDNLTITVGMRVAVPFGKQTKIGIVVDLPLSSEMPSDKLKPILQLFDNHSLFTDEMWELLQWASRYYHAPFGEVLQSALPVKLRQGASASPKEQEYFTVTEKGYEALSNQSLTRAKKQQLLLNELSQGAKLFVKSTAYKATLWRNLLDKGYITPVKTAAVIKFWYQTSSAIRLCNLDNKLTLNKQQSLAVNRVIFQQGYGAFLLNGVTGSGKTEVYLQVIEETLKQQKQVLVLIPEIGLTPQTIQRFKARFNVEIDVLHSHLSDTDRLNVWLRAKNGESAIVIGTRSALFTQFQQLGLIIIDEEQDSSFKQQDSWRYNARDLAILRAKNLSIPIILGSATPSLESIYNVQQGKFTELILSSRAGNAQISSEQLIDLKTQRVYSGLSEKLLYLMKTHLEQGNQVMLFLNRRGFAPVLLCHECGWVCQCDHCEKPYTYHQKQRVLRCHHCSSQKVIPHQCGHCGSTHLVTTGVGTEQLEQVLLERFPQYCITRIDRDSTARKGELEKQLNDIQQGKSQILIGTQMLAKGHHFPNVTLVAIVNVDSALFSVDFRAEERLAQLYVQVAGRSGRAEKSGEVVLQTHYPDHPLLKTLLTEGYQAFAEQALTMRKLMELPPFNAQVLFKAQGKNSEQTAKVLEDLTAYFQHYIVENKLADFQLLGPINAPMAKKAGYYRWQLLIQSGSRAQLQRLLDHFDQQCQQQVIPSAVRLTVDIDPQDFN